MRHLVEGLSIAVAALLCLSAPAAHALTFDFNSLSNGAGNSSVQSYMNGVISDAGVTGTVAVAGAVGQKYYNGDNHVVGPTVYRMFGSYVTSQTLGNTDGGVAHSGGSDTFLTNIGGETTGNDRIVMTFSFPVYSVSFDFEIFPDASCTSPSRCGYNQANLPDLSFYADNSLVTDWSGVQPGQPGGSSYTHSPQSGAYYTEKSPQLLGVSSTIDFADGVTTLSFVDWPQKIGIDNLNIDTSPPFQPNTSPVPEPSTLLLLASGLAGLVGFSRKRAE